MSAALKGGVRVTLRMGEQASTTNICGQQLYEAELVHPGGAPRALSPGLHAVEGGGRGGAGWRTT